MLLPFDLQRQTLFSVFYEIEEGIERGEMIELLDFPREFVLRNGNAKLEKSFSKATYTRNEVEEIARFVEEMMKGSYINGYDDGELRDTTKIRGYRKGG